MKTVNIISYQSAGIEITFLGNLNNNDKFLVVEYKDGNRNLGREVYVKLQGDPDPKVEGSYQDATIVAFDTVNGQEVKFNGLTEVVPLLGI